MNSAWISVPETDVAMIKTQNPGATIMGHDSWDAVPDDVEVLSIMPNDRRSPADWTRFKRLRAVLTRSDGYDHLPRAKLREMGVKTYYLEGYATESVAQLALAFMLGLLRRIPEGNTETQNGGWERDHLVGRHLGEVTIGVLGVGRIGSRVCEILSSLGADVVTFDTAGHNCNQLPGVRSVESMDELLRASDVLTIHIPGINNEKLIGRDELARLPAGALLVNTARGQILDQTAVAEALDGGQLGGYAADVLPDEPNVPDLAKFAGRNNVILTPHLGAHNQQTLAKRYRLSAEIMRQLEGGIKVDSRFLVPLD